MKRHSSAGPSTLGRLAATGWLHAAWGGHMRWKCDTLVCWNCNTEPSSLKALPAADQGI